MDKRYAQIALLNQSRHTDQLYTYGIPNSMVEDINIGSRVIIPFGQGNKPYEGFVMGLLDESAYSRTKNILAMPDQEIALTPHQIEWCEWLVDYCYCTLSEALQLMVPTGATYKRNKVIKCIKEPNEVAFSYPMLEKSLKKGSCLVSDLSEEELKEAKKAIKQGLLEEQIEFVTSVKTQYEKRVKRIADIEKIEKERIRIPKNAKKQHKILDFLSLKEDVSLRVLRDAYQIDRKILERFEEWGLIQQYSIEKYREPLQLKQDRVDEFKTLNPDQQEIYDALDADFRAHRPQTHLLHGITGSGKTEIYMHLTRDVVEAGKQVVLLVPEISLTPQIVKRFVERFGNRVAVLHSKLSLGERYDQWKRIKRGEYPIVIGARSALFAPCDNLGLIIIDEEHESAYKSEQAPRYYTHDVAAFLMEQHGCPMLLGSATPSIETYYRSLKKIYKLHELNSRFNDQPLPPVDIIDMREELQLGNKTILSERLVHALSETMEENKQAMLFLNRKGFSTFVSCRECGFSLRCPNCEISLTYYKGKNYAECKYCGYSERLTPTCPECKSKFYRHFGSGTERIEEDIRSLFPNARIGRLDSDTTSQKGALESILKAFGDGEIDLLIGTQMIAKGLDFPNVALVGVLSADVLINLPDYKASERAFQLLTQVAGRTGRGDTLGKVIFQTYTPDHYAIQNAQEHDYETFFKNEIQLRRSFMYPPYVEMTSLLLSASNEEEVIKYAKKLYNRIGNQIKDDGIEFQIYGPSPGIYFRLRNRYRYQVMIKYRKKNQTRVKTIINACAKDMHKETSRNDITLSVDHKPLSIV